VSVFVSASWSLRVPLLGILFANIDKKTTDPLFFERMIQYGFQFFEQPAENNMGPKPISEGDHPDSRVINSRADTIFGKNFTCG
jgi:hypothetical protein